DSGKIVAKVGKKSSKAKLTVNALPADFTSPLNDVTVKEKTNAEFECELSKDLSNVKWYKNGKLLKEGKNVKFVKDGKKHKLILSDVEVEDEGPISIKVGDKETTANLFVQEASPVFIRPLKDVSVKEGEDAEFLCQLNKAGATVKWCLDGQEVVEDKRFIISVDNKEHKLIVKNALLPDSGEISARVEDKQTAAQLTVQEIPIKLHLTLKRFTTSIETQAVFTCNVSKSNMRVSWFKDEEELKASRKYEMTDYGSVHKLILHQLSAPDYGDYVVVIGSKRMSGMNTLQELPLEITVPLKETEATEGDAVTLVCEVNKPNIEAQWFKDKAPLQSTDELLLRVDGTKHSLILPSAALSDEAEYCIVIKDKSSKAVLFVEEIATYFVKGLSDKTIKESENLSLDVTLSRPETHVTWRHNEVDLEPSEKYEFKIKDVERELIVFNVDLKDEGAYSCLAGEVSTTAVITIEETEAGFKSGLTATEGVEGEDVEFQCELSKENVKVRWLKNRKPLLPSERIKMVCDKYRYVLRIQETIPEDEGEYTVVLPSDKESSAYLKILPLAPVFVRHLEDIWAKETDSAEFECQMTKKDVAVQWLKNDKPITESDQLEAVTEDFSQYLYFTDLELSDEGEYKCMVGPEMTHAKLHVESIPTVFTKPLKDHDISEQEAVTFECHLNKPNRKVTWKKDGKEISFSDRIKFSSERLVHTLALNDAVLEDDAEYSCSCDDAVTKAKLTVDGKR
ncbi:hypothetical protein LOTGIDRAFT_141556, partial [Lottia gigantea]